MKTFECDLCSYETKRYSNLKRHKMTHKTESYQCYKCSKIYKTLLFYSKHAETCCGRLICPICNRKYVTSYNYELHKKSCSVVIKSTANLNLRSGRIIDNSIPQGKKQKTTDKKKTLQRESTALHLDRVKQQNKNPIRCKKCGVLVANRHEFYKHNMVIILNYYALYTKGES